ncbi:twin-arginine translocase TatA/TatE family subunit [Cellulomonas soli]|uniref:twin-arginine translocase TatA/TatE family subunit n=1 Tax=Cellulomonas soli TaxID=931535 RepID=UPI003F8420A6
MFDINGGEWLVLLLVAILVIGPERLPQYAEQLGVWARRARRFAKDARTRVDDELGEDIKDVDWAALDPRRYDPRRIVREALLDDEPVARAATAPRPAAPARPVYRTGAAQAAAATTTAAGGATDAAAQPLAGAPFDDEAT